MIVLHALFLSYFNILWLYPLNSVRKVFCCSHRKQSEVFFGFWDLRKFSMGHLVITYDAYTYDLHTYDVYTYHNIWCVYALPVCCYCLYVFIFECIVYFLVFIFVSVACCIGWVTTGGFGNTILFAPWQTGRWSSHF